MDRFLTLRDSLNCAADQEHESACGVFQFQAGVGMLQIQRIPQRQEPIHQPLVLLVAQPEPVRTQGHSTLRASLGSPFHIRGITAQGVLLPFPRLVRLKTGVGVVGRGGHRDDAMMSSRRGGHRQDAASNDAGWRLVGTPRPDDEGAS